MLYKFILDIMLDDDIFGWTSGEFDGWINIYLEALNAPLFNPSASVGEDYHRGPILWYGRSADQDAPETEQFKYNS